jgi:hypothetical protein
MLDTDGGMHDAGEKKKKKKKKKKNDSEGHDVAAGHES